MTRGKRKSAISSPFFLNTRPYYTLLILKDNFSEARERLGHRKSFRGLHAVLYMSALKFAVINRTAVLLIYLLFGKGMEGTVQILSLPF